MKIMMQFDAAASGYEVKGELYGLKNVEGVQSVDLLERASGDVPRFCVEVVVDDQSVDAFSERARSLRAQYAGYISNAREMSYRVL